MTATCTLCGMILSVEPDGLLDAQRGDRTFGYLGGQYKKHVERFHMGDMQRVLDESVLRGTLGNFFAAMAMTAPACIMYSFLESDDPVFQEKMKQMREIVEKAIAQKERLTVVQPDALRG